MPRIFALFLFAFFPAVPLAAQTLASAPFDGDHTVTVVDGNAADIDKVIIIHASTGTDQCDASSPKLALAAYTSAKVMEGGKTAVVLEASLTAGQMVCAEVDGKVGDPMQVQPPAAPPGYDWGLVRGYFTAGALTSQERDQFSHQDLFLAFDLDKTYMKTGIGTYKANQTKQNTGCTAGASCPKSWGRPGLDTFFEARMTALPVAVKNCDPTAANQTCSNANTSTGTGTGTGTGAGATNQTQTFLNSQKSARLLFGVFMPVVVSHWSKAYKTTGGAMATSNYALFLAPLAKAGFDTAFNGLNDTQQSTATPAQVQPVGSTSQFYKFYDFGFRVGHYEMALDSGTAHGMLSYLDVGFGRFSNLPSLLCPSGSYVGKNTCNVPISTPLAYQRDWRLNIEGLLEVPATHGFSIGFSSNVGLHDKVATGQATHILPPDDLRFLFAYKLDIGKLASKLSPQMMF